MNTGTGYSLSVSNVNDLANPANTIKANTTMSFTCSACVTSTSGWQNFAMANQTGAFEVTYTATPLVAVCDALMNLSFGPANDFAATAVTVRFNNQGQFDARNGSVYQADKSMSYTANSAYAFRIVVNVPQRTYSVFVTPAGGSETQIAASYAFRTQQNTVTSLNTWNIWAGTGQFRVCDVEIGTSIGIKSDALSGYFSKGQLSAPAKLFSLSGKPVNGSGTGIYIAIDPATGHISKMLKIERK